LEEYKHHCLGKVFCCTIKGDTHLLTLTDKYIFKVWTVHTAAAEKCDFKKFNVVKADRCVNNSSMGKLPYKLDPILSYTFFIWMPAT
jgi:hypothetical protein